MEKCKSTHYFQNETAPFSEGMIYVFTKLDVTENIGLLRKKGQW